MDRHYGWPIVRDADSSALHIRYRMAGTPLLFKLAAVRSRVGGSLGERFLALVHNDFSVAAVALYATLTVFWVWILGFTPLSRANVLVALAFAITPLVGGVMFGEPIFVRLVVGIAITVLGDCVRRGISYAGRTWQFNLAGHRCLQRSGGYCPSRRRSFLA